MIAEVRFQIDRFSGIDLANQIRVTIVGDITTGCLRAGEKLATMQGIAKNAQVTFRTARGIVDIVGLEAGE